MLLGCEGTFVGAAVIEFVEVVEHPLLVLVQLIDPEFAPTVTVHVAEDEPAVIVHPEGKVQDTDPDPLDAVYVCELPTQGLAAPEMVKAAGGEQYLSIIIGLHVNVPLAVGGDVGLGFVESSE
jgi:hypothetical protein